MFFNSSQFNIWLATPIWIERSHKTFLAFQTDGRTDGSKNVEKRNYDGFLYCNWVFLLWNIFCTPWRALCVLRLCDRRLVHFSNSGDPCSFVFFLWNFLAADVDLTLYTMCFLPLRLLLYWSVSNGYKSHWVDTSNWI